ncbi:hypothetical protein FRC06_000163, partial [Ceratobasidium sp. 370]
MPSKRDPPAPDPEPKNPYQRPVRTTSMTVADRHAAKQRQTCMKKGLPLPPVQPLTKKRSGLRPRKVTYPKGKAPEILEPERLKVKAQETAQAQIQIPVPRRKGQEGLPPSDSPEPQDSETWATIYSSLIAGASGSAHAPPGVNPTDEGANADESRSQASTTMEDGEGCSSQGEDEGEGEGEDEDERANEGYKDDGGVEPPQSSGISSFVIPALVPPSPSPQTNYVANAAGGFPPVQHADTGSFPMAQHPFGPPAELTKPDFSNLPTNDQALLMNGFNYVANSGFNIACGDLNDNSQGDVGGTFDFDGANDWSAHHENVAHTYTGFGSTNTSIAPIHFGPENNDAAPTGFVSASEATAPKGYSSAGYSSAGPITFAAPVADPSVQATGSNPTPPIQSHPQGQPGPTLHVSHSFGRPLAQAPLPLARTSMPALSAPNHGHTAPTELVQPRPSYGTISHTGYPVPPARQGNTLAVARASTPMRTSALTPGSAPKPRAVTQPCPQNTSPSIHQVPAGRRSSTPSIHSATPHPRSQSVAPPYLSPAGRRSSTPSIHSTTPHSRSPSVAPRHLSPALRASPSLRATVGRALPSGPNPSHRIVSNPAAVGTPSRVRSASPRPSLPNVPLGRPLQSQPQLHATRSLTDISRLGSPSPLPCTAHSDIDPVSPPCAPTHETPPATDPGVADIDMPDSGEEGNAATMTNHDNGADACSTSPQISRMRTPPPLACAIGHAIVTQEAIDNSNGFLSVGPPPEGTFVTLDDSTLTRAAPPTTAEFTIARAQEVLVLQNVCKCKPKSESTTLKGKGSVRKVSTYEGDEPNLMGVMKGSIQNTFTSVAPWGVAERVLYGIAVDFAKEHTGFPVDEMTTKEFFASEASDKFNTELMAQAVVKLYFGSGRRIGIIFLDEMMKDDDPMVMERLLSTASTPSQQVTKIKDTSPEASRGPSLAAIAFAAIHIQHALQRLKAPPTEKWKRKQGDVKEGGRASKKKREDGTLITEFSESVYGGLWKEYVRDLANHSRLGVLRSHFLDKL